MLSIVPCHGSSQRISSGIPTEEQFVQAYCFQRGLPYPIPHWNFYLAVAFFRMAAIAEVSFAADEGAMECDEGTF